MTRYPVFVRFVLVLALGTAAQSSPAARAQGHGPMRQMTITVGNRTFAATLLDNPTARAFAALLPLSIDMTELNGNEKFFRLPSTLPTQEAVPRAIQAGDLMLYGSSTLVLFYESFTTTYSYTTIGCVDDPSGLKAALGTGNVTVAFDVQRRQR